MITLNSQTERDQENPIVKPHHPDLYAYKQWPGRIVSRSSSASYWYYDIVVEGDATDMIAIGDLLAMSNMSLDTEYPVHAISYSSTTGTTTITLSTVDDVTAINLPMKDFVYKKYTITDYVTNDGIGDLRKVLEDDDFGNIRPYQLNISLYEDGYIYGTRSAPGVFYKDSVATTIVSALDNQGVGANLCRITLAAGSLSDFSNSLIKSYHVVIISGKLKNAKYKIVAVDCNNDTVDVVGELAGNITAGDTLYILIQQKYFIKMRMGIKGNPTDKTNVFFGVLYPKNISILNRRVDIITYSLVKAFEEEYAFQVSDTLASLSRIDGINVYSYNIGNKEYPEEYVAKLKYLSPSGSLKSVTGVSINYASSDTGVGARLLRFRRPNWLQYDYGSWVQYASESDNQTLTARDGSTINVDIRPSDYQTIDAEETLFFDAKNKLEPALLQQGPIGIQVDDGEVVQLYTRFHRIWVDSSYVAGTLTSLSDVSNDESMVIVPITGNHLAVYFSLPQKCGGMKIVGLKEKGTALTNVIWEYSLPFGNDPDCWKSLTVVDGTDGFSQDGMISWDIPADFGMKSKVGDVKDFHYYHIRFRIVAGSASTRTVDSIVPLATCYGTRGDQFTFDVFDYRRLMSGDREDDIIVRYNDSEVLGLYTWKNCYRAYDALLDLLVKTGYGVNLYDYSNQGLVTRNSPIINIWGKPSHAELRKPTSLCSGEEDGAGMLFACFKNMIMRLKSPLDNWETLYQADFSYTFFSIHYFGDPENLTGDDKNFVLATAFKNEEPLGTIEGKNYREQPNMLMVRIDAAHSDSYTVTSCSAVDGGSLVDGHTLGEGMCDTLHVFRSGQHVERDFAYVATGGRLFSVVGNAYQELGPTEAPPGNYLCFSFDNICIPYNQLLLRLNDFTDIDNINDLDWDMVSLMQNFTLLPSSDALTPTYVNPGYYNIVAQLDEDDYPIQQDLGLRYSFGHRGGNCKIYYPGNASHKFGVLGQSVRMQANWLDNERKYLHYYLKYGLGPDNNLLFLSDAQGHGIKPSDVGTRPQQQTARSNMLCAVQQQGQGAAGGWTIRGTYHDWCALNDSHKYRPNLKTIELARPSMSTSEGGTISSNMELKMYNVSLGAWVDIDLDANGDLTPLPLTFNNNDILLIADSRRFSRMVIKYSTTNGGPIFSLAFSNGSTTTIREMPYDDVSEVGGGLVDQDGIMDWSLYPDWLPQDDAGASITNKYFIKLTQAGGAGTDITIKSILFTCVERWSNFDNEYYEGGYSTEGTKLYDLVPLEMVHDANNDILYGAFLDQENINYHLFVMGDIADRVADSELVSNHTHIYQMEDAEMQPVGFVVDEDTGWVYFVAVDRKYQTKAAKLYRCKYSSGWTVEELSVIKEGEWDCPTNLACYDSKVYGFTGPNKGYFWEWSDELYIRIPVLDFGDKRIRESIDEISQLLNTITVVDEQAATRIYNRNSNETTKDKTWDDKHIISIEYIRDSNLQKEGVSVAYDDGEFSGIVSLGDTTVNSEQLQLDGNKHIWYPQTAIIIAEFLFNFLIKRKREIEGECIFLYQHQLFDLIQFISESNIASNMGVNDPEKLWMLKEYTLSWKRKNARYVLLENN